VEERKLTWHSVFCWL